MGLFGRVKKAVKRVVRKVENVAHQVTGQPKIGEKEPEIPADTGLRAEAAKRLTSKTQQAGGGQITYNTEETTP